MQIYKLRQESLFLFIPKNSSFLIRPKQLGDIWLFNCFEGCQHILTTNKFKISQIKKIVITSLNVKNISGLLGLLSSISLNTTTSRIDIYGPKNLFKYIFWGRKYSYTNFRYLIYIHVVEEGLITHQLGLKVYSFYHYPKIGVVNYVLLIAEQSGPLNSLNAVNYHIPFGPIYGYFKMRKNFVLPDGSIACHTNFVLGYYLGSKLLFIDKLIEEKNQSLLSNSSYLFYD